MSQSFPGTTNSDSLLGNATNDTMTGLGGNDSINGAGGNDSITGGSGNDTIVGGIGADTIDGGTDADSIFGGDGSDSIVDTSGNSTFDAGSGNDTIISGGGADSIIGGYGNDYIDAGQDRDTISWSPGQGSDTIFGGSPQGNPAEGDRVNLNVDGFNINAGAPGSQGMPTSTVIGNQFNIVNGFQLISGTGVTGTTNTYLYIPTGETLRLDGIEGFFICFYPGTMIATPTGERAVESLAIGDLVLTSEGKVKPVRWMGRQTVSTRFGDPLRMLPVRILAGALADGVPARDLLVSPDHALLVEGVLVQAGALVNGMTILRQFDVPEVFTYHHIELAEHDLVLAEGAPAETFVDNIDRLNFDNWAEHQALYGNEPSIPEMDRPRAKAQRQVPVAVRHALAERANYRKAG